MMSDPDKRFSDKQRGKEGDLVKVFHNNVERPWSEATVACRNGVVEEGAAPVTDDPHSIHRFLLSRPFEAGAEQGYFMSAACDAREDLVKVDLRPPGERVAEVLPVDNEYSQGVPWPDRERRPYGCGAVGAGCVLSAPFLCARSCSVA